MDKEQQAERYAVRLGRCLTAIKILIIAAVAAIAALIVFVVVALGVSMQNGNPEGVLLGAIIPGAIAVACVAGALASLIIARITMVKLKKLGSEQS